MPRTQSYASHAHRPTLTIVAGTFALVAAAIFVVLLVREPSLVTAGLLSLTIAVICLVSISRAYILRLQDRIIRLEMRTRVARLLPQRLSDFDRLSKRQIVALRFASDAELAALMERALTENLTSDQIKQAVKDWQADYHRT
jgi:hypothetical protein